MNVEVAEQAQNAPPKGKKLPVEVRPCVQKLGYGSRFFSNLHCENSFMVLLLQITSGSAVHEAHIKEQTAPVVNVDNSGAAEQAQNAPQKTTTTVGLMEAASQVSVTVSH